MAELKGTQNEYAWVGVAYLLTQTACQPLYGKLADVFGRKVSISLTRDLLGFSHDFIKPVIYGSTLTFLIGSALCGSARVR